LGLRSRGLEPELQRLLSLGATLVTDQPVSEAGWRWYIVADSDGNVFTLVALTAADLDRMADLVETHADLPLGAADASGLAVAERLRVHQVATLGGKDYAIYRSPGDGYYATGGHCTHEQTLLCDGLLIGSVIECPKHNGRFDYISGKVLGAPVLVDVRTYPVKVADGTVYIRVD